MEPDSVIEDKTIELMISNGTSSVIVSRERPSEGNYQKEKDLCIKYFDQWSESDQVEFVEHLISWMCHYQHGHTNSYLKPMLQRDFITALPGTLATCVSQERTLSCPSHQHPPFPSPARSRPYSCSVCGKRFSLKHQMETHYRVHTGEKPFSCSLCPQRSRDFSAMTKHLRTHGAAPYRCPLCRAGCPSLASMQEHMRAHSQGRLPPGWTIHSTFLEVHGPPSLPVVLPPPRPPDRVLVAFLP